MKRMHNSGPERIDLGVADFHPDAPQVKPAALTVAAHPLRDAKIIATLA
jgi:hypothetical protein